MSTRHWGSGFLAILVLILSAAPAAKAAGGKPKAAKPNQLTVAQADDLVVQLANEVFAAHVQSKNTHLAKSEFHKSQDQLRKDMVVWATNGKLRQILKSGWKPATVPTPDASAKSTRSTSQVDVAKIEKELKVSLPEFTDYTRYWVDKAMHELPADSKPKVAVPAHPAKRPPVVKQVVKKVVHQAPPKKAAPAKPANN